MFVFFDFDGVIANTEDQHMASFDMAFKRLGINAHSKPTDWVGKGTTSIIREVIEETKTQVPFDTIRLTRLERFKELAPTARLMPHALKVIESLSKDFSLGVVTSSTPFEAEPILERYALKPYFRVMVFGDMVARLRPHPDIYLLALQKTGTKEAVVVEDSEKGIQAAKAARLYCVAVPNKYTKQQDLSAADAVTTDLKEAEKLVRTKFQRLGIQNSF